MTTLSGALDGETRGRDFGRRDKGRDTGEKLRKAGKETQRSKETLSPHCKVFPRKRGIGDMEGNFVIAIRAREI